MKKIIVFLLIIVFFSCAKNNNLSNNSTLDNLNIQNLSGNDSNKKYEVPHNKLEGFLGKDFISVQAFKKNIDTDGEPEIIVVYRKEKNSNIDLIMCDETNNQSLSKKFEFSTEIFSSEGLLIQTQNLFDKNDLSISIEGKTADNKYKLYILYYINDEYNVVADFTAAYSIIVNYEDIEDEKGKFSRIKEIDVIDNIPEKQAKQKRTIYEWDNVKTNFKNIKTEEMEQSQVFSVDQSILFSEDKYFEYINGIWYPESYKKMIESNTLDIKEFSDKYTRYLFINTKPQEVAINHGDYIDKYSIVKISKLWNQKPGLRFVLYEYGNNEKTVYSKYVDLTLLDANTLQVEGPEKYYKETYIRINKYLNTYIRNKKDDVNFDTLKKESDKIIGIYESQENLILNFLINNEIIIDKKNQKTTGFYKLSMNQKGIILSLSISNYENYFKTNNFLINISTDKSKIILIPIKFDYNEIITDDLNQIVFYRK